MDFTREKENPVIPELPNIALPVHTPDLFSYTSQVGSGQFRVYRGGSGAFFDNEARDGSKVETIGGDVGIGAYFHGGLTHFNQTATNTTRKWKKENEYLANGDFQNQSLFSPSKDHAFFKIVGEKNLEDKNVADKIHHTAPLAVTINQISAKSSFRNKENSGLLASTIAKNERQLKRTVVSYLTASEAAIGGLDKNIKTYFFNNAGSFSPPAGNEPVPGEIKARKGDHYAGHHLSEITVTDDGGKRMIYGTPVYNTKQEEYSFAVGRRGGYVALSGGQIVLDSVYNPNLPGANKYEIKHTGKGIDDYFHKETQPAYASSFLLTGILSPDYVDKNNDGITSDDQGTAIKFNYSKIEGYKWRTPYPSKEIVAGSNLYAAQQNASLNRGLLADPDDNKASVLYGEKELYYVHSIKTKTQIAYFITEDRKDALGVKSMIGGIATDDPKQRCLKKGDSPVFNG
jgi:hypothetical protein